MTMPSAAEVEVAEWPALKAFASDLGLNPKGRSAIVRRRVLDHLRAKAGAAEWKAGKAEQAALLTRIGLGEAAGDLWESTISLDAPAPWVGLGTAYLRAGRAEEAMKCFDRAIGMGDSGARLHKAHALLESGKPDEALAEVEEAIAERSGDVRALARRVALAEAGGRIDDAVAAATALAGTGHGRTALARILMHAGRFEEAGKALEAHVAERPEDSVAWNNLGACFAKRGRWEKAHDAFRRAANLDPRDAGVLNNLAVALAATGKGDEALRRLQAARRIAEDPCIVANEAALRERMKLPAAPPAVRGRAPTIAPARPPPVAGKAQLAPMGRMRKSLPKRAPRRLAKPAREPAKAPAVRAEAPRAEARIRKEPVHETRRPARGPKVPVRHAKPARRVVPRPHPKPVPRKVAAKGPHATRGKTRRPGPKARPTKARRTMSAPAPKRTIRTRRKAAPRPSKGRPRKRVTPRKVPAKKRRRRR